MDIKEERRNSLLGEVFAADSEIRKLQDHIRDLLQRAVYMDIQRLGYVEKITMDSVDAFHYAITPGGHRLYPESMFEEGEERYRPPCMGQDAGMPSKEQETKEEHRYVTYATLPGSEKETVLEGDDLGKLFVKWREMEEKQDPEHKIRNVFVIDTNATSNPSCKYEIATGRDVTPVYLEIPEMSGDDMEQVTQWLKENGAEYDGKRNLWYVIRQDSSQFMDNFRKFIHEGRGSQNTKKSREKTVEEKKYYSYMYNKDGSVSRFTGSSVESVTEHWQQTAQGASGRGKGGTAEYFYVREKNAATGQLGGASRYETATGRDVTPVYLNLPHMSREEFAKTTRYLKENGARFNSTKKLWYVTRDQDPGRFEEFLHEHEQEGSRTSTVRKLADCRREAAAQAQGQPAGERKHERAR